LSKLSDSVKPRIPKGTADQHVQVTYDWLGPHTEYNKKYKRFLKALKAYLPGNLTPYTKSRSVIGVDTLEEAEKIAKLLAIFDADIVTIDNCETLYRFNLDEGNAERMRESPNGKIDHYQASYDFEGHQISGSEAKRQIARFYKILETIFPDIKEHRKSQSVYSFPTFAEALQVAKLAKQYGAFLVNVDACETLYRYQKKQE
jgi:hypothetical protein